MTARVLIVAAHPDDESIGAGALLARCIDAHVAFVTDGAPRERSLWPESLPAASRAEYAQIRREELRLALEEARIGSERIHLLEVTDREAGEHIATIARRLVQLLDEIDPDIVVTHAIEGAHVDHDATARAVHAAMAEAGRGHPHEMALYHHSEGAIVVHEFLPGGPPARTLLLDDRLRALKRRMLDRYPSQRQYERYFVTDVERYRCAPAYDIGTRQTDGASEGDRSASSGGVIAVAPLVSVIVRTIGRDTLVEALNSIVCQTYPNIEIVLVDASGAGSPAFWKDRDGRRLRPITRIGLDRPGAANAGLNDARGAFIAFLDDDDWFHPEHIAATVAALQGDPEARVAYSGVEVIECLENTPPVRRWIYHSPYDSVALLCENYIPLNGLLFERSLIDEGCRFDESFPIYEDWDFLIQLSRRTRFLRVPGISAVYRWPPGSGVNDSGRTGDAQERVFAKWRPALSAGDYTAVMRRAIEHTALNDARPAQIQLLQSQVTSQLEELVRLRSQRDAQENTVHQLRASLATQGEELDRQRLSLQAQDEELGRQRLSLQAQDEELDRQRLSLRAQDEELDRTRLSLQAQDEELGRLRPYVELLAQQLEQLRHDLQTRDEELDRLRPRLQGQEQQLEDLGNDLKMQDEELDRLRPCVQAQEQQLEQLRIQLRAQDGELAVLRPHVLAQTDDIGRLNGVLAATQGKLAAIRGSRIWRFTGPYRASRRFVAARVGRVRARLVMFREDLAPAARSTRWLVPTVRTLEVLLADGPAEATAMVWRRLGPRPIAPPPEYAAVTATTASWPALTIPPMRAAGGCASIVIPVLDHAAVTLDCLAAIATHTTPGSYEVIVVDNGSGEELRGMLARVQGVTVIRNERNAGFVEACNEGAAAARGDNIVFLNNDTAVLPGWLDALVSTLSKRPDAGAVGARLLFPDGRLQEAGSIIWNDGFGWNYGKFEDPEAPDVGYLREVDYCSGACLLVPKRVFHDLGGFDLRYAPAYYEDVDFCFRLREQGYSVLYQPSARVVHLEGATAGTDESGGFKQYQRVNREKFVERHRDALKAQCPSDPRLLHRARDRRRGSRILVVDHIVPRPDHDAGSVRMAAILQILVDLGHAVTFLPDNLARLEPYVTDLQQLGIEVLYGPMSIRRWLREHRSEFDLAILCRAYFAAKYLPALGDAADRPFVIFDTVDLHHLREERLAALENDDALRERAARTRELELGVMRRSDMVWVTSTHEARVLQGHSTLPAVELVPTIHRVRAGTPGFADRRHLLFVGGFLHPPNEDAVMYFVEHVLPLVTARLSDVQLLVVGTSVPPRIQSLASAHVDIRGYVKDLGPVFDSCRLSIAPLRYGAGVKGKITQSLAWGLPVVTTPIGAEGMALVDREHVMIGADAAEMASRIIETYQDEAAWLRLAENGRRYVEAHLGYETVRDHVAALLERTVRPTPAATTR